MGKGSLLIVEDDALIAADIEQALTAAGYDVVGIATSEAEAIRVGEATRPQYAIIDITLAPGDGRAVARALARSCATRILFATSQCSEVETKAATGALACLPKPYLAWELEQALSAVTQIADGRDPGQLPDHMFELR